MTIYKHLLFGFFILSCSIALKATHIVGGEITYTCLGNDFFEIKLSVYRDCFNGVPPFDDFAAIGIADENYQIVDTVMVKWNQLDDTLTIYLNNPCLTRPPNICVHRTTYTTIIQRPNFLQNGFKLIYQRCCRNELIRNIPLPEDVGITIISEVTQESVGLCNSSAVYNNWPPLAICVNEPIDFDHGATDPDGDSLAYRLCTPLDGGTPANPMPQPPNSGPYLEVTWKAPYTLSNLLGGVPLEIDPNTGFMTGIPNMIGNFVVGVCVDEFRNGTLLSTTRRDFQYNVADCGVPVAVYAAPEIKCNDLTVSFNNMTELNDLGITNWYFDWGGDLSLFSTEYEPTFTFPDTGRYQVALVVNPGYSCSDTLIQDIWLTETVVGASLGYQSIKCDENGLVLNLTDQSSDPQYGVAALQWNINGPNYSYQATVSNFKVILTTPGTYNIQLIATGGNECSDTILLPFNLPYVPGENLSDIYTICAGDSLPLNPDGDPNMLYTWAPNAFFDDLSQVNPWVTLDSASNFSVNIQQPNSLCNWERLVDVQVLSPGQLTASAVPPSIIAGQSSQLQAIFPSPVAYSWAPPGTLSDAGVANPIATPEETTDYQVTISTNTGCTQVATVRVTVLNPLCTDPFVFFPTGFSPNADGENDQLKLESRFVEETYWMIYDRWGEKLFEAFSLDDTWDGTYKGKAMPPETYGYYFRVRCLNGEIYEKKGNLTLIR